jgi:hypothetical protein
VLDAAPSPPNPGVGHYLCASHRRNSQTPLLLLCNAKQLPATLHTLRLSHSLPPPTTAPVPSDTADGGGGGGNNDSHSSHHNNDDETGSVLSYCTSSSSSGGSTSGGGGGGGGGGGNGDSNSSSNKGLILPVGVTLLTHHSSDPDSDEQDEVWGEEQEAARAVSATPTATVHMAGAYLRLAQSCGALRVLALPRQRWVGGCFFCGGVCWGGGGVERERERGGGGGGVGGSENTQAPHSS